MEWSFHLWFDLPCNVVDHCVFLIGKINTNTVSQVDRSDIMPNISFILTGDTKGGPPVINSWSRDGNLISNGGGYHISLKVNEVDTLDVESVSQVLRNCHYRSTLTVTGYLPGLYEYSVQNKAMNKALTANYAIQGITIVRSV